MGIGVVYHVILRCCFAGGRCPRPPRWSVLPGGAAPGPPAGVFCRVALPPAPPLEGRAALQTTPHGWAFGAIRLGVMPIGADALVSLGGFTDGPKRASALRAPVGAAPGPPAGVFCRVALPPAPPLEGRAALQTTPHGWAFGATRLGVMPIGPKRASALRAPVGAGFGPPAGGPCRPHPVAARHPSPARGRGAGGEGHVARRNAENRYTVQAFCPPMNPSLDGRSVPRGPVSCPLGRSGLRPYVRRWALPPAPPLAGRAALQTTPHGWAEAGFGLTCAGGRCPRHPRWRAVPPSRPPRMGGPKRASALRAPVGAGFGLPRRRQSNYGRPA
jgi:hypothetical protein